ncbi:hypothetical protein IPZ58_29535 [Streptomyces roseoverticillatus]|uniref:hypothetical protein n=1 Tax=Streptomyces roseoverticillatus TaxID=66429 RepID=UPI001F35F605|nr:hypothetical protein [Streptomyces roseoverticillatus]MCF3105706.1 hypothetical protein [Streptomyces roseoverticillatus]
MGAAPYLSVVQVPSLPQRGGRGPEGYIETVHRIYADKRAGHEAKELLLVVAYAVGIAPAEEGRGPLNIAARLLGRDRIGQPRFTALMAADAPRYEAPRSAQNRGPGQAPPCEIADEREAERTVWPRALRRGTRRLPVLPVAPTTRTYVMSVSQQGSDGTIHG